MASLASLSSPPSSTDVHFDGIHLTPIRPAHPYHSASALQLLSYASTPTLGPTPSSSPPPMFMPSPKPASLNPLPPVSSLARRIHGWSWQAFPIGMGTGAVYVILSLLKYHHTRFLTCLETAFFFINIILFILNVTTLVMQAVLYPNQARRLITDPSRSIFVPLMVLSFATIIIGTINYAVPSGRVGPNGIYIMFWVYVGLAVMVSFPMLMIWFNQPHDIRAFTPAWAFLMFPMMLVGVVASEVLRVIDPSDVRSVGILVVGYFFQGIGFFMTMFYICIYILRIMTTGFLEGGQANTAFVACGPPGFTAYAVVNLGVQAQSILPAHNLVSPLAGEVWYAGGVVCGLMLFGFAVFLFIFGIIPYWFKLHKHLSEILGCWALTFPNVGWISALRVLGDALDIPAFYVLHAIMATLMCATWLVLFVLTALAFYRGQIFFAKPEDVLKDEVHAHVHLHAMRDPFHLPRHKQEQGCGHDAV